MEVLKVRRLRNRVLGYVEHQTVLNQEHQIEHGLTDQRLLPDVVGDVAELVLSPLDEDLQVVVDVDRGQTVQEAVVRH